MYAKRIGQQTPIELTIDDEANHDRSLAGFALPVLVWVAPTDGDSVSVKYRASDNAPWVDWTPGTVTSYAEQTFNTPIAGLRFKRTASAGTSAKCGVN